MKQTITVGTKIVPAIVGCSIQPYKILVDGNDPFIKVSYDAVNERWICHGCSPFGDTDPIVPSSLPRGLTVFVQGKLSPSQGVLVTYILPNGNAAAGVPIDL